MLLLPSRPFLRCNAMQCRSTEYGVWSTIYNYKLYLIYLYCTLIGICSHDFRTSRQFTPETPNVDLTFDVGSENNNNEIWDHVLRTEHRVRTDLAKDSVNLSL